MKNIQILEDKIKEITKENKMAIIGIDGRCAAGKTTFSEYLKEKYNCNVVHMDHFFLPADLRTDERLGSLGGNIHFERILDEVFSKFAAGKAFSYKPYLCKNDTFGDEITIEPDTFTIVEGAYSCHPRLFNFYDYRVFFDVDADEQLKRIIKRNGAKEAEVFREKWIVFEERYFDAFSVKEKCDTVVTVCAD